MDFRGSAWIHVDSRGSSWIKIQANPRESTPFDNFFVFLRGFSWIRVDEVPEQVQYPMLWRVLEKALFLRLSNVVK